jgi:hypothetical protein
VEWYDWVLVAAVIYGAVALLIGFTLGRVIRNAEKERIQQEALREADASRSARLREMGRVTDVRPDASGPPAVVRPMVVLGKSPRHRPPTRM